MMKYMLLLFTCAILHALPASAQETQTLFGDTDIRHGGFGAPVFGVTLVNGQPAYLRGTRWAWGINFTEDHTINVGFGNYRTRSDFEPASWDYPGGTPDMRTDYGGFELEYVNQTHRLVHLSVQTLIGSGTVRYRNGREFLDRTSDTYFVLQPGINMNLNVTRWFRVSGGLHYRYSGGVNLEGTNNSDLSGITSFAALRFGWF